jgi:hypothetical protein
MLLYLIEPSWYDSEIPRDVFGSVEKVGVRSAPLGAKF